MIWRTFFRSSLHQWQYSLLLTRWSVVSHSLTHALQVGIHCMITNLNSLFLLKTKLIITDFVLLCYAHSVGNRMTSESKCLYRTFKNLPSAVCLILYVPICIQPWRRMFLRRHRPAHFMVWIKFSAAVCFTYCTVIIIANMKN